MNPRSYSNKTPASLSPDLLHFGDSSTIDPPINWCDDVHWLAIEMHQSSLIGLITRVNYNLIHSIKNFVQYTIFLIVFVCVCVSGEFRDGLNERPVRLRSHCSWMGKTKNHIESNSDFFWSRKHHVTNHSGVTEKCVDIADFSTPSYEKTTISQGGNFVWIHTM